MALRSALNKPVVERRRRRSAAPAGAARLLSGATTLVDVLARRMLAKSEDAALGTLMGDMQAGTNLDVDAQQGMEAAAALRRDLAAGADRMFQYAISITIAAPTPEELTSRV